MQIKFFAYLRDYTGCKTTDFPYEEDLYHLAHSLCDVYGDRLRKKMLTPDGEDLGEEIIILINGRHVAHLGGIHASFFPAMWCRSFRSWQAVKGGGIVGSFQRKY